MKQRPTVKIAPAEFVKAYYKNDRNATAAIRDLDPNKTEHYQRVKASETLAKPDVQLLIDKVETNINIAMLQGSKRLIELAQSEQDSVALQAIRLAMEYGKAKPPQEINTTSTVVTLGLSLSAVV